jgi:hypothetical protein
MVLPDFLVIGAQRAGTTWLDNALRSHPRVVMSQHRKEIHFFDQNFANGTAWYSSFFATDVSPTSRVGETTPHYLYHPDVPGRVAELIPDCQLIAVLRNPIDRAYSQYGHNVKTKGWTFSFEQAIESEPSLLERGNYAEQLGRFLRYFDQNRVLVAIFEEVTRDPDSAAVALGRFLGVDPGVFSWSPSGANASYVPRFSRSYAVARTAGRLLRRARLDAFVESIKEAGLPRMFGSRGELSPMSPATRQGLRSYYTADRRELEDILHRRIPAWD